MLSKVQGRDFPILCLMGQSKRGLEKQNQTESPPIAFPSVFGSEPNILGGLSWWLADTSMLLFCVYCWSYLAVHARAAVQFSFFRSWDPAPGSTTVQMFQKGMTASFPQDPPTRTLPGIQEQLQHGHPAVYLLVCTATCHSSYYCYLTNYPKLSCLKKPLYYAYWIWLVRNLSREQQGGLVFAIQFLRSYLEIL